MSETTRKITATFEDGASYTVTHSSYTDEEFLAAVPAVLTELHGEATISSVEEIPVLEGEKIWKFFWDCGRMGNLEGTFVATEDFVNTEFIGQHVYFGEILGKHSEIHGTLDPEDFSVISEDPEAVANFKNTVVATGVVPWDYMEED